MILFAITAHAAPADQTVQVTGAWVRASAGSTAAAYLDLANSDGVAHSLVGARTSAASTVELHTTVSSGGVQQMRPTSSIRVEPGRTVSLAPGGKHLMLIGLDAPLTSGTVSLTLEFDDGSEKVVRASVRR